jgi:hypothetical protein
MKPKFKIFIYNHLIYLNENQRYDLFACIPVTAYGIMMKAQINARDLEPQSIQEIFCNYIIDCTSSQDGIEVNPDGKVIIHLPPQPSFDPFPPPFQPNQLEKYDLYDLLNRSEGGREELFYETRSEDLIKWTKSFHKVEIKDEKQFYDSMEFVSFNTFQVS